MGKLQNAEQNPFYIFVSGPAGSGKSLLLKALRNAIITLHSDKDSCFVAAPTVIAAKNVDGGTIASTFLIKWSQKTDYVKFSPRKKSDLECKLSKTKVLLLDAINYVNAENFNNIDKKLREALNSEKPFGGVSVIVFGDFFQLEPYGGESIYQNSNSRQLWNLMKLEELNKNENVFEAEEREVFEILRSGGKFLVKSVIDYMKQNCQVVGESLPDLVKGLEKMKNEHPEKTFAVLALQNDLIKDVNNEVLKRLGNEKAYAPKQCIHNLEGPTSVYTQAVPDQTSKRLSLAIGSQVMLTAKCGMHNHGQVGRVIELAEDIVTVRFPNGTEQVSRSGWYCGKSGWLQFPLISAEAFSIHKSQGMTFDGIILVGKMDERQSKAIYTALSRAKSLKLCQITHMSTLESLMNREMETEKEELRRMRNCS